MLVKRGKDDTQAMTIKRNNFDSHGIQDFRVKSEISHKHYCSLKDLVTWMAYF